MTLFDFEELTTYWAEHPPLHILVGAYFGMGKDKPTRMPSTFAQSRRRIGSDPEAILAELGPGFNAGDVHAGLAPVVLDFAELRHRANVGN
jgi:hypothetical protein